MFKLATHGTLAGIPASSFDTVLLMGPLSFDIKERSFTRLETGILITWSITAF